jgi:diadenylate cyclase
VSLIGLADVVDILLVTLLLWVVIAWLRRSRARFALAGIAIVGLVYLVASRLRLELTAWILQGFFAVFVIFVVVVFQEDIRRLFEQIAIWGLRRRGPLLPSTGLDTVVRAAGRLAANKWGALIVVPGREPLDRFLEGGASLDAWLSEPLLLSLFDPSSPGHDGAVIVAGNRVTRFMVHLPLSADRAQLGTRGTRHAAGLGLAERSDACCIVVSEERGTISVARDGELRTLVGAEGLAGELHAFHERMSPRPGAGSRWERWKVRLPEMGAALAAACGLWFLMIPGGSAVEVERNLPVVVENLPEGYTFEGVDPDQVRVVFSGERRILMFEDFKDSKVRVDALLVKLGRRTFELSSEQVVRPPGLQVEAIEPDRVKVSVSQGG